MVQRHLKNIMLLTFLTSLTCTPSMSGDSSRNFSKSSVEERQLKHRFQRDISTLNSPKDFLELTGETNPFLAMESLCNILRLQQKSRNFVNGLSGINSDILEKLDSNPLEDKIVIKTATSENVMGPFAKRDAGGHMLSIVAPLETLRRVKAYRDALHRFAQQQRQIQVNDAILAEKGKRTNEIYSV